MATYTTERGLDRPICTGWPAMPVIRRRTRVAELESRQLPAPLFDVPPGATRVVLFGLPD